MKRGLAGIGLLLLGTSLVSGQAGKEYLPVAPPAAVHAGLVGQLKQVRDWLGDKDYTSAVQAVQGLEVLAALAACQGDAGWGKKCSELQATCRQLAGVCKQKNAAQCKTLADDCGRQLEEMAKALPAGKGAGRPPKVGTTKAWMLLMDGAYVDAKSARSTKELEELAYLLAEEGNALAHFKAGWDKMSAEVRDAALGVVKETKANGLDAGKKALKAVYQRCEECHLRNKK